MSDLLAKESILSKFEGYHSDSRVWVYPASRVLTDEEAAWTQQMIDKFTQEWTAHKVQLQAKGLVLDNAFIVLAVNEDVHNASGCSIDSSVKFILAVGEKLKIDFFNRLNLTVERDNGLTIMNKSDLKNAITAGEINGDTMVYQTHFTKLSDLDALFRVALKESWANKFIGN